VRPGSYPGGRNPAHIHFAAWGPGYPAQWSGDLLFADDPLVGADERARSAAAGRFANVCGPSRDEQGRLLCARDHRLKRQGDRFPPEVRHVFREGGEEADDGR
jgi:protocatechuate 3,4-dioxygenase beta subunit